MATSSDLYTRLAAEDERNKPSPYFRSWDGPVPETPEPRRGELAKRVMENIAVRAKRKNA
jgi:hypothetical protein